MFVKILQFHGNEDPDEVLLDSEMEKVFAGPSTLKEKFDVTTFQDTVHPIGPFKNKNCMFIYTQYTSDNIPVESVFQLILAHRKNLAGDLNIEEDSEYENHNEPVNAQNYDDIPEDFPLVSERAGHGDHSVISFFFPS